MDKVPLRWLGIDFSGNHQMWSPRVTKSNVWIATISEENETRRLLEVCRVQELSGDAHPFSRLATLLARGEYEAAGIDAPFSLPHQRVPSGSHEALLRESAEWECGDRRPFPSGGTLVGAVLPEPKVFGEKVYRQTEMMCPTTVNVRSTLWAGPRGGAAMTAACLALLRMSGRPIWPFAPATSAGLLVEAFPAAQLEAWGIPFRSYNDGDAIALENRRKILHGLSARVDVSGFEATLLDSADALDAAVCCFAGIAARRGSLRYPCNGPRSEGWIAVHS